MDMLMQDQEPDPNSDDKPPRWSSEAILRGQCEAIIVHGDDEYRLRCTSNNKLILNK